MEINEVMRSKLPNIKLQIIRYTTKYSEMIFFTPPMISYLYFLQVRLSFANSSTD